jgi:hypothetical protein
MAFTDSSVFILVRNCFRTYRSFLRTRMIRKNNFFNLTSSYATYTWGTSKFFVLLRMQKKVSLLISCASSCVLHASSCHPHPLVLLDFLEGHVLNIPCIALYLVPHDIAASKRLFTLKLVFVPNNSNGIIVSLL